MSAVDALRALAARFQDEHIIPHCVKCAQPCCKLDDVVLDLSFAQVQTLYRIGSTKKAFDQALPPMIKRQGDRYYAHGTTCPAYDTATKLCRVYTTKAKPEGCTDFPIYVDDGDSDDDADALLVADRRCEAVRAHEAALVAAAAKAGATERDVDDDFPDLFLHLRIPLAPPPKAQPKRRR